ncbi:MAG: hypothetical protein ACP5LE_03495 [Thermoplasmata archaeon]
MDKKQQLSKRGMNKKWVGMLVLGLLVLSAFAILTMPNASAGKTKPQTKGIAHAPIHINGNSDFTRENGVIGASANIIHHNNFWQNNGAGKGVSGNCQAYDDVGGNYWYDDRANDGNGWGRCKR